MRLKSYIANVTETTNCCMAPKDELLSISNDTIRQVAPVDLAIPLR